MSAAFLKTCIREVVRCQNKRPLIGARLSLGAQQYVTNKRYSSTEGTYRPETSQARSLLDIGTRRIFSEEHDILRQSARRFYKEECVPYHAQWEEDGNVSREVWEKAGEQGLLGICIPEEAGGLGGEFLLSVVNIEEQIYANVTGPGFCMHSDLVMEYVAKYGTKEQIQKFIPDMTAGKVIGALAMTEPGAGSDLQGIRTYARKDGDDWILNGSKIYITNGYMCGMVIVVAVTKPDAKSPAHGISLFMVEEGMPGFTKGKKLKKMGMHAQDTAELFFDDVRLPASALLGKENRGFYLLMKELPKERLFIAIYAQGHAEFMFEEARNYVMERKAYGRPLSKLQVVQHKLAELKTEICMSRAFVDVGIEMMQNGTLDSQTASMLKYRVSDMCNSVAYDCVQLHGGAGYMQEYPICKAYADARVQPIFAGANEVMKDLIAREITST